MTRFLALSALVLLLAACDYQSDPREARTYDVPSSDDSAQIAARPVQIGFDGPRFDACASYGEVTNLNPDGTDTLAVRAAPADSAPETDQLAAGSGVAMCQKVAGWFGIVYPPPAATAVASDGGEGEEIAERIDCGTGSPIADVRNYEGPCRSGWVRDDYVKLVAG